MSRFISIGAIAIACLIVGYLIGFQRGTNRAAANLASFNDNRLPTTDYVQTFFTAFRNARSPVIIEISTADASKPILNKGTRYSFVEAKRWLDDLTARFGSPNPVLIVLHERDPIGTISAIVELANKYSSSVYTILLSDSNTPCYGVTFFRTDQAPGWEIFMQNYHFATPAPKDFTVDMNKILLAPRVPSPASFPHN